MLLISIHPAMAMMQMKMQMNTRIRNPYMRCHPHHKGHPRDARGAPTGPTAAGTKYNAYTTVLTAHVTARRALT